MYQTDAKVDIQVTFDQKLVDDVTKRVASALQGKLQKINAALQGQTNASFRDCNLEVPFVASIVALLNEAFTPLGLTLVALPAPWYSENVSVDGGLLPIRRSVLAGVWPGLQLVERDGELSLVLGMRGLDLDIGDPAFPAHAADWLRSALS